MKIGIVGSGMVGSTSAFALVMNGVGREIVLVDRTRVRAEAEAHDILDAVPFAHPLTVRAGDYADLVGCRVVVITAGIARAPGETRFQVLQRNVAVFEQVVPFIVQNAGDAILVVVSNPVDIMTHVVVAGCEGVTLGLPHLVGGQGAMGAIPLPLVPIEQEALERSASILREAIESLKLT